MLRYTHLQFFLWRLQTRNYDTSDGQQKSHTEIIITDMIMLDAHIPRATEAHTAPPVSTTTHTTLISPLKKFPSNVLGQNFYTASPVLIDSLHSPTTR
jgi:hypothetical protein